MIGTLDITVQAAHPAIPLPPLQSYVGSPSSVRVRNVPKRIGDWCIREVAITVIYPDGAIVSAPCVCVGGVWVGTVAGTQTSGTSENGYTIFASGTDENNQPVENYILGKGNVEIIEADGTLSPDPARYYVKLLSAEAQQPREGDMYPTGSGYAIWQNGQANQLGTPFEEITAYVDSAISSKADLSAIPTKTSQLANDSGFVTSSELDTSLELKQDKLSEDQTYVIDREVNGLYTQILTPTGSFRFVSPATLDKSVLIQQGIISQDGNTWLYSPQRVILGSSVVIIGSNTFKDAIRLEYFEASNATIILGNAFNGCTLLNTVKIPSVSNLGAFVFRYCSALKQLTLPKSVVTVSRQAFGDNSLDYVIFEGKTLAQVKAMTNFSTWGLTEDKIHTNAFENQLPTKTSDLTNDSGFITAAQVPPLPWTVNDDFGNLNWDSTNNYWIGIDPTESVKLILSWNETSNQWELAIFSKAGTSWDYGSTEVKTGAYDDTTVVFQSYTCTRTIVAAGIFTTQNWVLEQLSALEARIAALEGN